MVEPGVVSVHNPPDARKFALGSFEGNITPELLEVKGILELFCHVDLTENLSGFRWAKLTSNATFSGMSAVMSSCFGDVAADPKGVRCVARIGRECFKVAKADGVNMVSFGPLDYADMYNYSTAEEEDRLVAQIQEGRKGSKAQASMLNDLRRGYDNVEIDDINGVICRLGRKHGVPTPYNDKVVEIVKGICQKKFVLSEANINYFDELLSEGI
jgi:2-dehydropantoate 2-reductase